MARHRTPPRSSRAGLARLPAAAEAIVAGLDAAEARQRPAPDEWWPVEILCHLRDEEAEDFGARLWAERWPTLRVEYAGDIPYSHSG